MKRDRLLGVVLAGGESRRFGSPKALASFRGIPMVRRAMATLTPVCREVAAIGSPEQLRAVVDGPVLSDVVPGAGPLGGLHAGLLAARDGGDDGVFLLACDMPLVSTAMVDRLMREAEGGEAWVVAPARSSGEPHPLCSWYSCACLDAVARRLSGPDRSLQGLLRELEAKVVSEEVMGQVCDPAVALRSANTRSELAELANRGAETATSASRSVAEPAGPLPPVICVVGYKDSGKTSVAVGLVAELRRRGHTVAAVKHGHAFRLDTPGTDSWRIRYEGGADPVLLAGPEGFAFMGSWQGWRGSDDGREPDLEELIRRHLPGAGVVVVEGYKATSFPKIEVFRAATARTGPFVQSGLEGSRDVVALVTDAPSVTSSVPILDFNAPELAERLADLVEGEILEVPG